MKRLLVLLAASTLALAGCGDTCEAGAAPVDHLTNGCGGSGIAAGAPASISVFLCPKCSESRLSCTGEVLTDAATGEPLIELNSTSNTCQANAGCDTAGCSVTQTTCALDKPLQPGVTYTVRYPTSGPLGLETTTVTASSGAASSCTL